MPDKNDITASAGIDLSDWKKQVAQIANDLSRIQSEIEKTSKSAKTLQSSFKVGSLISFGASMVSDLAGVKVAVGDTSDSFKKLKVSAFSDSGAQGFDKVTNAMADIHAASDGVVKKIPLVGEALSDVSNITRKYAEDELRVAVLTGKEAESLDALTGKLSELRDARTSEQGKTLFKNDDSIERLNTQIDVTAKKYVAAINSELEAGKENRAGQTQSIALAQLEIEKKQKLASLSESLKNQLGEKGAAGTAAFDAGAKKIERENELKKRGIEFSQLQEKEQTNLNEIAADTGIKYGEQLHLKEEEIVTTDVQIEKAKKLYGEHSMIVSQLKRQRQELELAKRELEFQHQNAVLLASEENSALEAQMAGNKTIADLEKNRVAHADALRNALRLGNDELANQIAKNQAINDLEIRAQQIRKTPQQRNDERREQQKQDQAIRVANARDKVEQDAKARDAAEDERNKKFGFRPRQNASFRRSGEFVSPATAKARAEFAARHAPKNVAAAQDKLNQINAQTIIVQEIKNTP